jgi:hypothetical protein
LALQFRRSRTAQPISSCRNDCHVGVRACLPLPCRAQHGDETDRAQLRLATGEIECGLRSPIRFSACPHTIGIRLRRTQTIRHVLACQDHGSAILCRRLVQGGGRRAASERRRSVRRRRFMDLQLAPTGRHTPSVCRSKDLRKLRADAGSDEGSWKRYWGGSVTIRQPQAAVTCKMASFAFCGSSRRKTCAGGGAPAT